MHSETASISIPARGAPRVSATATAAPILPADDLALVPISLVSIVVGLRDSAIYERIQRGRMPAPLRLSYRVSRWRAGDIRTYLRDPFNWAASKAIDAPASAAPPA